MIKLIKYFLIGISVFSLFSCTGNEDETEKTDTVPEVIDIDKGSRADKGGSGVMLQGFTWGSPDEDGRWYTTISNNAAEIKDTFEYVWFPPCTDCTDSNGNGYLPRQLNMLTQAYTKNGERSPTGEYLKFYGTEEQLKKSIEDIKPAKAIADIVINHRCGTTDWGDFTNPDWGVVKNQNYSAICKDDEGFSKSSTDMYGARYKGAADTGEGYSAARDIDHTNEIVQDGIITWMNDILKKAGFVGWRYDMVKGYDGVYTGYYNAKTTSEFSVGEYWDGSYNKIASWIERTAQYNRNIAGKPSRAFDFVLKYSLNGVFGEVKDDKDRGKANSNYSQLANQSNLYKSLPGYAVTFVDNHDTGSLQKTCPLDPDDIGTAYAFILTHPGYPCVAWYHYFAASECPTDVASQYIGNSIVPGTEMTYHEFIKNLVTLRKTSGITDMSEVNVIKADANQYVARVQGTDGSVIVAIGASYSPSSEYNEYGEKYSGTNFQIFVKR